MIETSLPTQDTQSEGDSDSDTVTEKELKSEISLLSPLMPLKFGNGLLLQYTVNMPGKDDKLYFLEIGLATGLTSLALALINTLLSYILISIPSLLGGFRLNQLERLKMVAKWVNRGVCLIQVALLIFLFLYSVIHWNLVNYDSKDSPYFVKKRIFMFSLVVSSMMFLCSIVACVVVVILWFRQPTSPSKMDIQSLPPAPSFLPLGLANALLGLYIGIPGDDDAVVGPKVFLLDLCLYIGTITVVLTVMQSILRLAILVALRDGILDAGEAIIVRNVHLARYLMAGLQFFMFCLMFGHCIQLLIISETDPDFRCPRNLLVACSIISGVLVGSGLLAGCLICVLALS